MASRAFSMHRLSNYPILLNLAVAAVPGFAFAIT
jgi:hypothetical protein